MRRFEAGESFLVMMRWLFGACGVASVSGGGGDDDSAQASLEGRPRTLRRSQTNFRKS